LLGIWLRFGDAQQNLRCREVIEQSFRNASIDGGEVTQWVNRYTFMVSARLPVRGPTIAPLDTNVSCLQSLQISNVHQRTMHDGRDNTVDLPENN
jgi:hypothetical protein